MLILTAPLLLALSASQASTTAFDKKIEALLAKAQTPGCAIAFAENGQVKFAKGYGFANLEHRVRMKPESVHELASVSKQFTAACILQLAEKGKLSLDDPLSKFFEGAHRDWSKVRVRHLLQHSGGLPDYLGAIGHPSRQVTDKQLVDSIKDKPLHFEPGSRFEYSNSGYMLLGLIVARASGTTFEAYLRDGVIRPAGMKTARFNSSRAVVLNRADGYTVVGGKVVREDYTSPALSGTGDGQVMASALDMVAWDAALRSGKVLSSAMQKLMSTPGPGGGYGFGVGLHRDGKNLVQSHGGGWMGTVTHFIRYVDEKKCLAILCNSDSAPIQELIEACELQFLKRKVVSATKE